MRTILAHFLISASVVSSLLASPPSSSDYTLVAHGVDTAGGASTSANYSQTASVGLTSGVASSTGGDVAKAGYLGQLYDITGFALGPSLSLNEGTTTQISGFHLLDDATRIGIPPSSITWSLLSGPLTSISTGGMLTTGVVYQSTAASVRGIYQSQSSDLTVTVLNVNPDDFGSYAADNLPDHWQVQFFGLNNPLAGPNADSDGDGQNNAFELLTGTIPNNNNSRFTIQVGPVTPSLKVITISPYSTALSYEIQGSSDLISWDPLETIVESYPDGGGFVFLDGGGIAARKFYRVRITEQ
jgi:hypothetical protein